MSVPLSVDQQTLPELNSEASTRPVLGVQISETDPSGLKFHGIWDHELDSLLVVERPVDLGLATGAGGAFLGLLPALLDAYEHVINQAITQRDYFLSLVAVACLVSAVIFGFRAAKASSDAAKILQSIRSRPSKPHRPIRSRHR